MLVRRESCSKMKSAILGVSEVLDLKLGIKSYLIQCDGKMLESTLTLKE